MISEELIREMFNFLVHELFSMELFLGIDGKVYITDLKENQIQMNENSLRCMIRTSFKRKFPNATEKLFQRVWKLCWQKSLEKVRETHQIKEGIVVGKNL